MANITIASTTLSSWHLGDDVHLRIYPLAPFVAADGSIIMGAPLSPDSSLDSNFYEEVACSVVGQALTIASCTLASTMDSLDNPGAAYGAYFFTNEGEMIAPFGEFASFQLAASPTSTTWGAISQAQGKGNQ